MKTDVWMAWYPGDYLRDTRHLTCLEHGAYRQLIDAVFCAGGALSVTDSDTVRLLNINVKQWSSIKQRVKAFFQVSVNGEIETWRHKRVTEEIHKAKQMAELQRQRTAKARAQLQRKRESVTKTVTDIVTTSPSPSPSPSQYCTQTNNRVPTLEEVKTRAGMTGMLEADAVAFWNHFEASGWIDKNGHPVVRWQAKMDTWKTVARAAPLETAHHAGGNGSRPKSVFELRAVIEAKNTMAAEIRARYCSDAAIGHHWSDQTKRTEYLALKRESKALLKQLGNMA